MRQGSWDMRIWQDAFRVVHRISCSIHGSSIGKVSNLAVPWNDTEWSHKKERNSKILKVVTHVTVEILSFTGLVPQELLPCLRTSPVQQSNFIGEKEICIDVPLYRIGKASRMAQRRFSWLSLSALRLLETIATRLEAIAIRLEVIAARLEALAWRSSVLGWRPSLLVARTLLVALGIATSNKKLAVQINQFKQFKCTNGYDSELSIPRRSASRKCCSRWCCSGRS